MNWIDLYDGNKFIGKYDVPREVTGRNGQVFRINFAVRKGGNGVVFDARRLSGGASTSCAVKMLRRLDDARHDRFTNEVRILAALDHPQIASSYDSGSFQISPNLSVPWVALELGGSNLREHVESKGPLQPDILVPVCTQICDALGHLHEQGLIHRDVKPDNFVWHANRPNFVRMIDFGIAKYVGEDVSARPLDQFTQQMEFVGPVFFSSPELIAYARDKTHPVDRRSDLFQFAKVIWYLATGRISAGVPARKLCPMGGSLRDTLLEILSDDPDDRPATSSAVAERLRGLKLT